jgi:hypothetical protein
LVSIAILLRDCRAFAATIHALVARGYQGNSTCNPQFVELPDVWLFSHSTVGLWAIIAQK